MEFLIIYLIIINALGLLLMLIDKKKAIQKQWRIPEKALLGVGLIGGSLGCILGMRLFRHKTKKPVFFVGLPLMLMVHILIFMLLRNNI